MAGVVKRYKPGGCTYITRAMARRHLTRGTWRQNLCKLAGDRAPLPVEALTVDSSLLTAIGNDYGFEQMFSGQLAGKLTGNDVFPDITMYGNSPNIFRSLEQFRIMGVPSVVFCRT
ncbi:MAG: hypothetical protein EHM80_06195 [Nitrospiraceae bacterium]|nr:MAG: hypothetical protein EHM80_06195 [Nitrospiraceae bacterium]